MSSTVRDYMATPSQTISEGQPLTTARAMMSAFDVHLLSVLEQGRLVGTLSDDDLAALEAGSHPNLRFTPVRAAMRGKPLVVGPDAPMGEVARAMFHRGADCAVVVVDRRTVGVLTVADAWRALADADCGW